MNQKMGTKISPEEMEMRMERRSGDEVPPAIQNAQMIAQHAMGMLSDMLKGGASGTDMVLHAFDMADQFEKEFQKRIAAAVHASSKHSDAAESRIIR